MTSSLSGRSYLGAPAAAFASSSSSGVGSLTIGTSFAAARGTQHNAEIMAAWKLAVSKHFRGAAEVLKSATIPVSLKALA